MYTVQFPFLTKLPRLIIVPHNEGMVMLRSSLGARRQRHGLRFNPKLDDFGIVGRKLITTAGVNYLRDDLAAAAGGADVTNFKYHAAGTGTTAEAIGDTALVTEVESRGTGTQVAYASKQYQSVGTVSFTTNRSITEHGLFSNTSGTTLWDRTVFTAIAVGNGDSIQFTYTLSLSDGG